MFFIVDGVGHHQPYVPNLTKVGLRPEGIARVRALGRDTQSVLPPEGKSSPPSKLAFQRPSGGTPRRLLLTVGEVMSKPVVNISARSSAEEARQLLERSGVRHLPAVSDTGTLRGLLSQRDILRLAAKESDLSRVSVQDTMTQQVLTTVEDASIRDAAAVMLQASVGSLPVVDALGHLLGMLTRSDILRAVVHEAPLELWG